MKLVVTIPAYNEEKTIDKVIHEIPRDVADIVEIVVVNDGSTDDTVVVAKKAGADRIINFKQNRGLAQAFKKGLQTALEMDADIIVNIDADGQYNAKEIIKLIEPIITEEADIVLGSRFKGWIEDMPIQKKIGNMLATKVTAIVTGQPLSDAQTGFRAFSREAALKLNVLSNYTYVQETIIQAVNKGLVIEEVPCQFRRREGKSRLIPNIFSYAKRSGLTILETYRDYKPLETFLLLGGTIFLLGVLVGLKVLIHYFRTGLVSPYLPSAILTAVLVIVGFQIMVLGLIADMIGNERKILEEVLYRLKK